MQEPERSDATLNYPAGYPRPACSYVCNPTSFTEKACIRPHHCPCLTRPFLALCTLLSLGLCVAQSAEDVHQALLRTLEGHQRQILGTLTVEELYKVCVSRLEDLLI